MCIYIDNKNIAYVEKCSSKYFFSYNGFYGLQRKIYNFSHSNLQDDDVTSPITLRFCNI